MQYAPMDAVYGLNAIMVEWDIAIFNFFHKKITLVIFLNL